MSHAFTGFVNDDGKLSLDHQSAFRAFYQRFKGHEIEIECRKRRTKRSDRQNRAYHALLQQWCYDEGHEIDYLKLEILKNVFGTREVVSPITGEVTLVATEPHTSKLDTVRFAHLMERTVELAAGCGVILELPDEFKARKKLEAKARAKADTKRQRAAA